MDRNVLLLMSLILTGLILLAIRRGLLADATLSRWASIATILGFLLVVLLYPEDNRSNEEPTDPTLGSVQPTDAISPTKTSQSDTPTPLQFTDTPEPTSIPTITSTPDLTSPETATRAYLEALSRRDITTMRRLVSQYSLDFLHRSRDTLTVNLNQAEFQFEIGEAIPIGDATDTVFVPVKSQTSGVWPPDCCILRKENNEWHINWGLNVDTEQGTYYTSLVDYRYVDPARTPAQSRPDAYGVTIELSRIVRFSQFTYVYFSVRNGQNQCVHMGTGGITAVVLFGNEAEAVEHEPTYYANRKSADDQFISLAKFTPTYPTGVEFPDWRWQYSTSCSVPNMLGSKWSYQFDVNYLLP
jgi:hypothetical protein